MVNSWWHGILFGELGGVEKLVSIYSESRDLVRHCEVVDALTRVVLFTPRAKPTSNDQILS